MPIIAFLGAGLTIAATQGASAQLTPPSSNPAQPILNNVLAFKSQPDECEQNPNAAIPPGSQVSPFVSVGSTGNTFYPGGLTSPCPSGSQPKVNTSYAWGMTQTGSHVWIGTAVSGLCLTAAGLGTVGLPGQGGFGGGSPSYVCEFNSRTATPCPSFAPPTAPNCPGTNDLGYGDWRPPHILHYDTKLKKVTDHSSDCSPTAVPTCASTYLNLTVGLRSAGSTSSIVFLAGLSISRPGYAPVSKTPYTQCDPNVFAQCDPCPNPTASSCPSTGGAQGIYLFAFTPTGTYLGSKFLPAYSDIRRWVVMNGQLYTGVRNQDKTGRVLHWIGTTTNPFVFEEIADIEALPSYITVLGDQLYLTTWGGGNAPSPLTEPSGLWVSPHKPVASDIAACGNGSGPNPARCWTKIWDTSLYEPDPITQLSLIGGALEVYNNQIYWGLMQVPSTGSLAWNTYVGLIGKSLRNSQCTVTDPLTNPATSCGTLVANNSNRATPLFRYNPKAGSTCMPSSATPNVLPNPNPCQMLYGTNPLPVLTFNPGSPKSTLSLNPSGCPLTGCQTALYGQAGFGNPQNYYMWSSAVYQNRLYFGTLDWQFITAEPAYISANPGQDADFYHQGLDQQQANGASYGGDLWRIDNPNSPAKAESLNGLGNYLSYGIRNMVADACNLYVGMANAMNLRTSGKPQGGMEFRVLSAPPVHGSGC
jgi:hypothetical protein